MMARPHYFGAMMTRYGQADALLGSNKELPAALFRAAQYDQALAASAQGVQRDGALCAASPEFRPRWALVPGGLRFDSRTDCRSTFLDRDRDRQAARRHFVGRTPKIAMLSHSTRGSARHAKRAQDGGRYRAGARRARGLDLEIDSELQAAMSHSILLQQR